MNETIGNRIQKFRREKGLTQEALAEQLGVSAQAVSKWENDSSCPDISLLPLLCQVLGITTDELLSGKSREVSLLPPNQRKGLDELILRIHATSSDGDKVRVNLPVSLLKLGMELGTATANLQGNAEKLLKMIDFENLLAMMEQGIMGKLVEVESADGDFVEIFVE